ncbi:hypothetical protein LX32DRAFT_38134 [Colletotrichum zoysiae]|uniref:Uncharacterized protein n=1 Tax=Colletotrichum zoysiae TaxID=1216348 RepID=A0AAD9LXI4_9PEZI|nr:hypothetical protein LX32DRAFT_38134 [Colletotrichum zoysiae]
MCSEEETGTRKVFQEFSYLPGTAAMLGLRLGGARSILRQGRKQINLDGRRLEEKSTESIAYWPATSSDLGTRRGRSGILGDTTVLANKLNPPPPAPGPRTPHGSCPFTTNAVHCSCDISHPCAYQ